MSRPPAFESFNPACADVCSSNLAAYVYNDLMPKSFLPRDGFGSASISELTFDDIFADGGSDRSAVTMEELKPVLDKASGINFTSAAENKASGEQPDYFLGEDGKLVKNPDKKSASKDGSVNIEVKSNKGEIDAKKYANELQKMAIKDLISYLKKNNPEAKIPEAWQAILDSQPDIPDETPTAPPPSQPVEMPSSPAGSGGDGGAGGGSGGGSGGSGGGYSPGGDSGGASRPSAGDSGGAPNFNDATDFVGRVANEIKLNEGSSYTAWNADDNGHGISVGLRQWNQDGALPGLIQAWHDADPQRFNDTFKENAENMLDGNWVRSADFNNGSLNMQMKQALEDPVFQKVQDQQLQDWVKAEVQVGLEHGLTTERELATYVDLANQYGDGGASRSLDIGSGAGDNSQAMNDAIRGGKYESRYENISRDFSAEVADLSPKTDVASGPAPLAGDFNQQLAQAVLRQDAAMPGQGYCATAVQRALAECGMPEFVGSGNAWDMLEPLKNSGKFVEVPADQATVGDIIVRPPSADPNDSSIYGDISVVTARDGDTITQTNDDSYQFHADNARYDGRAVFLRHVA